MDSKGETISLRIYYIYGDIGIGKPRLKQD